MSDNDTIPETAPETAITETQLNAKILIILNAWSPNNPAEVNDEIESDILEISNHPDFVRLWTKNLDAIRSNPDPDNPADITIEGYNRAFDNWLLQILPDDHPLQPEPSTQEVTVPAGTAGTVSATLQEAITFATDKADERVNLLADLKTNVDGVKDDIDTINNDLTTDFNQLKIDLENLKVTMGNMAVNLNEVSTRLQTAINAAHTALNP